ncbi:MAG TPA: glycosyltransferase family 39 protein, partial [Dehalococcoidia bacterium]|nr:glycosyltransferase family 39 protein [Dehalococcoidia bacterium]
MRNPLRWAEERPAASLALLVAAAFSLRLAFAFWTGPLPPVLSDAQYYDAVARSLVSGAGYSVGIDGSGFTPGGSPTAFFPPGYPFFLAGVYRLFGHSLDAARVANCAAAALSIVPVYLAGHRLFGRREGLLAAGGTAVSPSLVYWTPVLVSESLFLLPFLLAVALMLAVGPGGG